MKIRLALSMLLISSAVSLSVGGIFLYVDSLVPLVLVETTVAAVLVLFALSFFVVRGNMLAINLSTILGILAPILSYSTPAHVGVLEQIGTGGLISFLGTLQLLGFYVFPICFVVLRIALRKRLTSLPVKNLSPPPSQKNES